MKEIPINRLEEVLGGRMLTEKFEGTIKVTVAKKRDGGKYIIDTVIIIISMIAIIPINIFLFFILFIIPSFFI